MMKEVVPPDPAAEAEGHKEWTGLHPVGSSNFTVGAEDKPPTGQTLRLPAARPADKVLLSGSSPNVLATGHTGTPEVNFDRRIH